MNLSVSKKTFIGMMGFGLVMGIVFPIYARFFTTYKEGMKFYFDAGCLLAGLMVGVMAYLIAKHLILSEIKKMAKRLFEISKGDGDLTQRMFIESPDCVGELVDNFNHLIDKIQKIVTDLKKEISYIGKVESEFSIVNNNLNSINDKLSSQSICLTDNENNTNDSVHKILISTDEIATNVINTTNRLDELENSFIDISQNCKDEDEKTNLALVESQKIVGEISHLREKIEIINEFVQKIKSISTQTNILAINASIEAAVAGQKGKGFAIVAQEVKNLAGQTEEITKDINGKISETLAYVSSVLDSGNALQAINNSVKSLSSSIMSKVSTENQNLSEINKNLHHLKSSSSEIESTIDNTKKNLISFKKCILTIEELIKSSSSSTQKMSIQGNDIKESINKITTISNEFKINK